MERKQFIFGVSTRDVGTDMKRNNGLVGEEQTLDDLRMCDSLNLMHGVTCNVTQEPRLWICSETWLEDWRRMDVFRAKSL